MVVYLRIMCRYKTVLVLTAASVVENVLFLFFTIIITLSDGVTETGTAACGRRRNQFEKVLWI